MHKKKRFNNNCIYDKKLHLNSFERIWEILSSFFRVDSGWLSKKNSKKYLGDTGFQHWIVNEKTLASSFSPVITWVGQACFLIQVGGINILTDPNFLDLLFVYPRNLKPGVDLKDLPKIDFIIISHNHCDHMEKKSLLELKKDNPTILVPLGDKKWFDKNGFENVYEKDWWSEQSFSIDNDKLSAKFSFLPAVHWSGTSIFDINKTLWGSWMVECAGVKVYFTGDSAYSNHFKQIGEKFNSIDIALMPIAPCEPREQVKYSHIDARESVQAFIDLKAKHFVAMHWGTFKFGGDNFFAPIRKLEQYWNEKKEFLIERKLHVVKFGEPRDFDLGVRATQSYYYESL